MTGLNGHRSLLPAILPALLALGLQPCYSADEPLPEGAIARLGSTRFIHPRWITALTFSPDGSQLATAGEDGRLRSWEVPSGKQSLQFKTKYVDVEAICYSPDGKQLIVGDSGGTLRVYDAGSGLEQEKRDAHKAGIKSMSISRDGARLVTACGAGEVKVWNWKRRELERTLVATKDSPTMIGMSPDGMRLLAVNLQSLFCWDPSTGRLLRGLKNSESYTLAVSNDSAIFAVGDRDGVISIRSTADCKLIHRLVGHRSEVRFLSFAPDDGLLASIAEDHTVRFWDVKRGRPAGELPGMHTGTFVAFSPDRKVIATTTYYGRIRLWDARTRKELTRGLGHWEAISSVAFAPDGRHVVTAGLDGVLRIWNPVSGKCLLEIEKQGAPIKAVTFSVRGRWLASGDSRGDICLWDPSKWTLLGRLEGQGNPINSLSFSCRDHSLVAAEQSGWKEKDGWVQFWNPETRKPIRTLSFASPRSFGCSARHSPDGKVVVQLSEWGMQFLDAQTGKVLQSIASSAEFPYWGCFFNDGQRFLQGADDRNTVKVWDWQKGVQLLSFELPFRAQALGTLSPDDRLLAIGTPRDATIRVLHLPTKKEVCEFRGHIAGPDALTFSPDGSLLASGGDDGVGFIWDIAGKKRPGELIKQLTERELEQLWERLADDNPRIAHESSRSLTRHADQAISFFERKIQPVSSLSREQMRQLVLDLGSKQFRVRLAAEKELEKQGAAATDSLRAALKDKPGLEERRRIEQILALGESPFRSARVVREDRALEILEGEGTPQARKVLEKLAAGSPNALLTREAKAALQRLQLRMRP
jgi:WD40 repeat protein